MKNILIIEDERTVAELERDYLEINSLKVSIEETGEGGLKRILKNDIDLIILDLMLPDMKSGSNENGNEFWNSMCTLQYVYISQTVNDQHAENCGWKKFSNILNELRSFPVFTKYKKRQETCSHCTKYTKSDSDDLLS